MCRTERKMEEEKEEEKEKEGVVVEVPTEDSDEAAAVIEAGGEAALPHEAVEEQEPKEVVHSHAVEV